MHMARRVASQLGVHLYHWLKYLNDCVDTFVEGYASITPSCLVCSHMLGFFSTCLAMALIYSDGNMSLGRMPRKLAAIALLIEGSIICSTYSQQDRYRSIFPLVNIQNHRSAAAHQFGACCRTTGSQIVLSG
jgi:hypothetical protein